MKTVLAIFIGTFFLLSQVSLQAADNNHKCQAKPAFEKPNFVTRPLEAQTRMEVALEKPMFEIAHFEKAQMTRPVFDKSAVEKPVFVQDCIESMAPKRPKTKENTKDFTRVPVDTGKEWGKIQMNRHKLHVISHHELKIRRSSIYRK